MFTRVLIAVVMVMMIAGVSQAAWTANANFEDGTVGAGPTNYNGSTSGLPAGASNERMVAPGQWTGTTTLVQNGYTNSGANSGGSNAMSSQVLVIDDFTSNASANYFYCNSVDAWAPGQGTAYVGFDLLVDTMSHSGQLGIDFKSGADENLDRWALTVGTNWDWVTLKHNGVAVTGALAQTFKFGEVHRLVFGLDLVAGSTAATNSKTSVWLDGQKLVDLSAMSGTTARTVTFKGLALTSAGTESQRFITALDNITVGNTIPEPATMCLLGLGGLLFARKRS